MKRITSLLYLSVLLLCANLFSLSVKASHCAGGEITYEWVSDSTYKFTLRFYRDCAGTTVGTTFPICYYNADGSKSGSFNVSQVGAATEVSPGCPGYPTKCTSTSSAIPGFQEYVYTANFTLPGRSNWTFYTYLSARNGALNYSGQPYFYVDATLNNTTFQGYSSPVFSVKPVPYVCLNQPYAFNNGAVDPNSDSLAFEMISPRQGSSCANNSSGITDILIAPYNLTNNPFACNNTFLLNALTGQMNFTPSQMGAWAIAVKVKKYRNGLLLGTVVRDIQIQVLSCNSVQPSIATIASSITGATLDNTGTLLGCANNPLSFCFNASSTSTTAVLIASDNHAIATPGSTVTYTGQGTANINGCFSWVPGTGDTGMKTFTITIKDSTCQPPGIMMSQTFTIPIFIRPAAVSKASMVICPGGKATLSSSGAANISWNAVPGGSGVNTLSCLNCPSPVAAPSQSTIYYATSIAGTGCNNTDSAFVTVDRSTSIKILPSDTVICHPTLLQLQATVTGQKPFKNLPCTVSPIVPTTPVLQTEVKPYLTQEQSATGSSCSPLLGTNVSARHQYLVKASDMTRSGMFSGTIKGLAFKFLTGFGSSMNNVKISVKCTNQNELKASNGFESGMTPVYNNPGGVVIPSPGGYVQFNFSTLYNWDTTQNLIVDICYSNAANVNNASTYYTNTNYNSTLFSTSNTGDICNGGIGTNPTALAQLPVMRFEYYQAPEIDEWTYIWDNGVFDPNANIKSPKAYVSATQDIYVSTYNRFGCLISDTLSLYVPSPALLNHDTNICEGAVVDFIAKNAQVYQWYEDNFLAPISLSCDTCPNPTAKPTLHTKYILQTMDHGCVDTFSAFVKVSRYPKLEILTSDTIVKYGSYVKLRAIGADHYLWQPQQYLTDPLIANPVAYAVEPIQYTLIGTSDSNTKCWSYDTVKVSVDYSDPVLIPSAFSPNNDGMNDIFRVANLAFRKIYEFRVFNRWGKEVFVDGGSNKGWDGKLNGVEQESGVYNYIIRIGVPDGSVQVYKGDVTLIR